jgi:teichoic acid transport system ATP-binding protein
MSAIILNGVSKRYNIYDRPLDRLKEVVWRNRRCFHREFWALRNINLTFERGTVTALLGPNGSGKSTLLQIIANVLQPTSGNVTINGRLTAILELGAGFQPEYTGRENVLLNGMILGIPKAEILQKMDSIVEFADIGDFFDQPVKTYSSGMTVRLAFSSAINVDPDILLVDEALAVGDANFRRKCVKKMKSLKEQGKTIIFVSHDTRTVQNFCHRSVLFNGGEVIANAPTLEVIPQYEELMEGSGVVAPKVFHQPGALASLKPV